MITLRELVKSDRAIAAITADECHLIASVIDQFNLLANHWFLRFFIPKEFKNKMLDLRMLAATLDRTPAERESHVLTTQIQHAMNADKK